MSEANSLAGSSDPDRKEGWRRWEGYGWKGTLNVTPWRREGQVCDDPVWFEKLHQPKKHTNFGRECCDVLGQEGLSCAQPPRQASLEWSLCGTALCTCAMTVQSPGQQENQM